MTEPRYIIELDNLKEISGQIVRGKHLLLYLPSGNEVYLNIIIASGKHPGPTFLITSNIHGDEVAGIIIVHRLIERLSGQLENFRGKLVCIPSLNPTGLLTETRHPQFEPKDPNRAWPDAKPKKTESEAKAEEDLYSRLQSRADDAKGIQEAAWELMAKLFIEKVKPDYHLDLHTYGIHSHPFTFLDRVLYGPINNSEEEGEKQAKLLWERTHEMAKALGLSIFLERPAKGYVKSKLHRSTSGFTLNYMRIPSATIEIGPMNAVPSSCRDAVLTSIFNVLHWSKMLDSPPQQITQVPVLQLKEPHRYIEYPQMPHTGIVDWEKNASEQFKKGDVIAYVRSMDGTLRSKIIAEMDGYVIGWYNGIACYEGSVLGMVAVPDGNTPKVASWSSVSKK